jgi:preprotein translocase subunit YajC
MTHALGAVALSVGNPAVTNNKSQSPVIYILLVVGAAFYFFIYRPQKKKQQAAQTQANTYEVGDEVVTAGGIVGRVLDITDDRVTLETSVGASFTVLRPYVLRKLEPAAAPSDVVDEADGDREPVPPGAPPHGEADDEADDGADDGEPHDDEQHDGTSTGPSAGGAHGVPGDGAASGAPPARPTDEGSGGSDASGADGPPII